MRWAIIAALACVGCADGGEYDDSDTRCGELCYIISQCGTMIGIDDTYTECLDGCEDNPETYFGGFKQCLDAYDFCDEIVEFAQCSENNA